MEEDHKGKDDFETQVNHQEGGNGEGKRKRKRRRAPKQLDWEEKKKREEEEDKKAVLKELKKPKVKMPKRVKKGMSIHDFRPEAPRITTSDWMNVHEKDVEVVDKTNLPPAVDVLEGLDNQFGTMEQLLEQEDQRQTIDRLTKETKVVKLEKEIASLKEAPTSTTK